MKWFINFYLDESATLKHFFTIAGFYNMSNDHTKIKTIENKIQTNILRIEKKIKLYRQNHEPNLTQYISSKNIRSHNEVKWNTLSDNNKNFLIQQIKNVGQQNISMHCNLKQWKTKTNKPLNLDAIYNMMVYYLVDRTLKSSNINLNDEILIKIYIDQRKSIPKTNNKNRLESLEGYINTVLYSKSNFKSVKVKVEQLKSFSSALIRYCDYYAGLTSSMCRVIFKISRIWDQNIELLFEDIHKKISCLCYYTIKNQCSSIDKLSSKCNTIKPT